MIDWEKLNEIPGWMNHGECEWLANLAKTAISWTEIGVYCGKSMTAVGSALSKNAFFQLIDIKFEESFYPTLAKLKEQRPDLVFVVCEKSSVEAAKVLTNTEVVFVDGDHTYEGVYADIVAWQYKCKILCGHDYSSSYTGVTQAVREFYPDVLNPVDSIWVRK